MVEQRRAPLSPSEILWALVALLILGAGFIADSREADEVPSPMDTRIDAAAQAQAARIQRPLNAGELDALREVIIDDEALVLEARALGLAQDDHIVRRRLAQKRRALLSQRPPSEEEPTESEREQVPQAITHHTFRHIFFSRHRPSEITALRVAQALEALETGKGAERLGDPFIRGRRFAELDGNAVARIFGEAFRETLSSLELQGWREATSTYGTHLVWVEARTQREPAENPTRQARQAAAETGRVNEASLLRQLRKAFKIVRHPAPEEAP